jgi:hypothetical protein
MDNPRYSFGHTLNDQLFGLDPERIVQILMKILLSV